MLNYQKNDLRLSMRLFWKYLFWILSFLTIIVFYLLNSSLGNNAISQILSSYLSSKTKNDLKVSELDIRQYPKISMKIKINERATATFKGLFNRSSLDMQYHLVGDSFKYNRIDLDDKIDIVGHISGSLSQPYVEGDGKIFDGEVAFSFSKLHKSFKNLKIALRKVESKKLLIYLKKRPILEGKADVNAYFKEFSRYTKEGEALVYMEHATMPLVSGDALFAFKSKIAIKDMEYHYDIGIKSDIGNMLVENGYYHKSKHDFKATYAVEINDLSYFKNFLKHNYRGCFASEGEVRYSKKNELTINGKSNTFGGVLNYRYLKEKVELKLQGVSLEKLLHLFSYPPLLSAEVYGSIDYHPKDKMALINTELKKTKFRQSKMTQMVLKTTGIDMLKETYDKSSFVGGYQNGVLSSILKIDNGVDKHIYLTDTKIVSKTNAIESKFEVKIAKEELYGTIYGTLKHPKVSVDMQKLLKYQLNKQIGNWLGTEKKEVLKEKLNSVKKDVSKVFDEVDVERVKDKAKSFLNGFF